MDDGCRSLVFFLKLLFFPMVDSLIISCYSYCNEILWSWSCVSMGCLWISSSVSRVLIIILCYILIVVHDYHGFCGVHAYIWTSYGGFFCCWLVVLVVSPWEGNSLRVFKFPATLQLQHFDIFFVLLGECLGGWYEPVIPLPTISYAIVSKMSGKVTITCMNMIFMYFALKITLVHPCDWGQRLKFFPPFVQFLISM